MSLLGGENLAEKLSKALCRFKTQLDDQMWTCLFLDQHTLNVDAGVRCKLRLQWQQPLRYGAANLFYQLTSFLRALQVQRGMMRFY